MKEDVLREYLGIIRRWWWLLVVGALVPLSISYYLLSRQPTLYQAKVTLMVGTTIRSVNPDTRLMSTSNALAQAYAELVRRAPITEAVIQRLNLATTPQLLARRISSRVRPEAQLLEISVVDTNPTAAKMIASALADELIQQSPGSNVDPEQRAFNEKQLVDLRTRITQIDEELQAQREALAGLTSAAEITDAEERIAVLERTRMLHQSTYASLLQSIVADQSPNYLVLFEPATATILPRQEILIMLVSALAGLALALGAAVLIEYLDGGLRWEGNGQQPVLGLPVLGAIPRMPGDNGRLAVWTSPESLAAESIRALRTTINLRTAPRAIKVLLIASPSPQDGKSVAIANLGAAMAGMGLQTILVDADLRRPQLHTFFKLPNDGGLIRLLNDHNGFDTASFLQPTSIPNLSLVPAGGPPPLDPTSLLTSPRFIEAMQAIKERADIVLIDSPAVLAVPDAAVLATFADGILLLVDAETTNRRTAMFAKNALAGQGHEILGIVFNRVRMNPRGYGYYYAGRR